MGLFGKLFSKKDKTIKPVLDQKRDEDRYQKERDLAKVGSYKDRLKLAANPQTHLEILYYLAEDQDVKVRRAVAKNEATPLHVSAVLADDDDVDVRLSLAERLMAMLPELDEEQHSHLYAFAVQSLGVLALDEVLKVRLALSSTLKDKLYTPPKVASQLARDIERRVSEPVLKLCAAIPDQDLIDILLEHPESWVIEAIAGRDDLHELVSDAVIDTGSIPGGTVLIENQSANISEATLGKIVERAKNTPEWHRPLALRKHLPANIMLEITQFVDHSIQKLIMERTDFDKHTQDAIRKTVKRRMNFLVGKDGERIDPKKKVLELHKKDKLDEDVIADAMALRENGFVIDALALRADIGKDVVERMVGTHSAKAVTALCWKAGLSMRFALEMQKEMAKVNVNELLYPKHGENYPLTDSDMEWQVEFFLEE